MKLTEAKEALDEASRLLAPYVDADPTLLRARTMVSVARGKIEAAQRKLAETAKLVKDQLDNEAFDGVMCTEGG